MYRIIDNLIKAINNQQLVHMKYELNESKSGSIKILPLHMFEYKSTYYLSAKQISDGKYKTFKVEQISSIELGFFIMKNNITLDEALSSKSFNKRLIQHFNLQREQEIAKVHKYYGEKSKKSANNRHEQILQYFIAAMNKDDLKNITINLGEGNHFMVGGDNCVNVLKNPSDTVHMPDGFTNFYRKFSNTKDTDLFLGYPLLSTKTGEHYPFLYCEVVVEEATNSLQLKQEKFFINKRFASESIDYSLEDSLQMVELLVSKTINLDGLDDKFKRILKGHSIVDQGVLFLEKSSNANYSTIKEFKTYMGNDLPSNIPYRKIIEPRTLTTTTDNKAEFILSPVLINYSQRETVMKSAEPVLLCQGPPGTGKTQTIINIIASEVFKGSTVLVASTNNKAVDNVKDKLIGKNTLYSGALRLGDKDKRASAKNDIKEEIQSALTPSEDTEGLKQMKDEFISKSAELDYQLNRWLEKLNLLRNYTESRNTLMEAIAYTKSLFPTEEYITNYTPLLGEIDIHFEKERVHSVVNELEKMTIEIENYEAQSKSKFKLLISLFLKKFILNRYRGYLRRLGLAIEVLSNKSTYYEFAIAIEQYKNALRLLLLEIEKEQLDEQMSKMESLSESEIKDKISPLLKDKIETDTRLLQLMDDERRTKLDEEEVNQLMSLLPEEVPLSESKEKFSILTKLFPVILCTNQSIPNSIPVDYEFDLVIIDEASQCTIPVSLPAIKRAKRLLVVGDDKQLKPVVGLSSEWDDLLLEEHRIKMEVRENSFYKYSANSIFDFFRNTLDATSQVFLNEHFRCHPDIVQFSNQEFYNDNLIISKKPLEDELQGIRVIDISTKEHPVHYSELGNKNPYEVAAIIEFIENNFDDLKSKTIGIITPFQNQYEYIKEILGGKIRANSNNTELKEFYTKLLKNDAIGSVHTFQGGEKDIIFFSTVVGFGMTKPLEAWLNREENLINVANTRAINALVLVGDMEFLRESGGILKKLALYVENIARKIEKPKSTAIFPAVHQVFYTKEENERIRRLLNESEKKMFKIIKESLSKNFPQYDVYPKVRLADVIVVDEKTKNHMYSYALKSHFDFLIFNKQSYVPKLAYEFDGPEHDQSDNKRKDDMKDELCRDSNFIICRHYYKNHEMEKSIFENLVQFLKGN